MRAGDLDRRVTLRRQGPVVKDALGGISAAPWYNLATRIAAQHLPVSDGEAFRGQQTAATVTDRFRIRWAAQWADLNPKDQLEFEGALYGIVRVKPLGRRHGLEITGSALASVRAA